MSATATSTEPVVKAQVANVGTSSGVIELIREKAAQAGLNPDTVIAVARCESNYRQTDSTGEVLRGLVTPADVGLFQINENYHLATSQKLGFDIYTTEGNIDYAMWLMKHEGIQHWNWSKKCWAPGS